MSRSVAYFLNLIFVSFSQNGSASRNLLLPLHPPPSHLPPVDRNQTNTSVKQSKKEKKIEIEIEIVASGGRQRAPHHRHMEGDKGPVERPADNKDEGPRKRRGLPLDFFSCSLDAPTKDAGRIRGESGALGEEGRG